MSNIQETIDFCLIVYLKTFRYHAFENTYVKSIQQLVKLGKWHGDVFKYFWMPIFTFRHLRRLRLRSTSFQLIFASQGYVPPPSSSSLPAPSCSSSPVKVTIHLIPVHFRQSRLRSTSFQFIFATSFQLIFTSQGYDPPPSSSFSLVTVMIHLLPVHLRLPGLRTTSFQFVFASQGYDPPPSWSFSPVNVTIQVPSRSSSPAKGYHPPPVLFKYDGRRVVTFVWRRWFSIIWDCKYYPFKGSWYITVTSIEHNNYNTQNQYLQNGDHNH